MQQVAVVAVAFVKEYGVKPICTHDYGQLDRNM
jgi:hypothetical protein